MTVAIKGCRTINKPQSGKPRETNDNKKTPREVNIIKTEFIKVSQTLKANENLTYTLRSYAVVVETPSCVAITLQELGQHCDSNHPKSMITVCSQQAGGGIHDENYQFGWIRCQWKSTLPEQHTWDFMESTEAYFSGVHLSWAHVDGRVPVCSSDEHHGCHSGTCIVDTQPSSVEYSISASLEVVQHDSLHTTRGCTSTLINNLSAESRRQQAETKF